MEKLIRHMPGAVPATLGGSGIAGNRWRRPWTSITSTGRPCQVGRRRQRPVTITVIDDSPAGSHSTASMPSPSCDPGGSAISARRYAGRRTDSVPLGQPLPRSGEHADQNQRDDRRDCEIATRAAKPATGVPLAALPDDVSKNLVAHLKPMLPAGPLAHSRSRIRHAIRDCRENSSMKPGDAACSNSPPDWEKVASWAS